MDNISGQSILLFNKLYNQHKSYNFLLSSKESIVNKDASDSNDFNVIYLVGQHA